ncbi:MAG: hypothetical protein OEW19_10690 [Acidobacteriota bacterium]|nr:hypothetical protein [Acidobacteriota bacterium]
MLLPELVESALPFLEATERVLAPPPRVGVRRAESLIDDEAMILLRRRLEVGEGPLMGLLPSFPLRALIGHGC